MDTADLGTGDFLPVVQWQPVDGAVEYELQVQEADGDHKEYAGLPLHRGLVGEDVGRRDPDAQDPRALPDIEHVLAGPGPWSARPSSRTRSEEPHNPASDAGQNRLVLSWDAKTGTKQYKVQVSSREDFAPFIESKSTDNPTLRSNTELGLLRERRPLLLARRGSRLGRKRRRLGDEGVRPSGADQHRALRSSSFKLSSTGRLVKSRSQAVNVTVKNLSNLAAVFGASVRASGQGVLVTRYTNSSGVASFTLRPTRLGLVTFRVSKSGYATKTFTKRVYAP